MKQDAGLRPGLVGRRARRHLSRYYHLDARRPDLHRHARRRRPRAPGDVVAGTSTASTPSSSPSVRRMKLHGYFRSSAAFRVRIALNLKGLAYECAFVHLRRGEQKPDAYRALNPQGLVPALEDDGRAHAVARHRRVSGGDAAGPAAAAARPGRRARVRALAQAIACDIHPLDNLRVLALPARRPSAPITRSTPGTATGSATASALRGPARPRAHGAAFAYGDRPTSPTSASCPRCSRPTVSASTPRGSRGSVHCARPARRCPPSRRHIRPHNRTSSPELQTQPDQQLVERVHVGPGRGDHGVGVGRLAGDDLAVLLEPDADRRPGRRCPRSPHGPGRAPAARVFGTSCRTATKAGVHRPVAGRRHRVLDAVDRRASARRSAGPRCRR